MASPLFPGPSLNMAHFRMVGPLICERCGPVNENNSNIAWLQTSTIIFGSSTTREETFIVPIFLPNQIPDFYNYEPINALEYQLIIMAWPTSAYRAEWKKEFPLLNYTALISAKSFWLIKKYDPRYHLFQDNSAVFHNIILHGTPLTNKQ